MHHWSPSNHMQLILYLATCAHSGFVVLMQSSIPFQFPCCVMRGTNESLSVFNALLCCSPRRYHMECQCLYDCCFRRHFWVSFSLCSRGGSPASTKQRSEAVVLWTLRTALTQDMYIDLTILFAPSLNHDLYALSTSESRQASNTYFFHWNGRSEFFFMNASNFITWGS